MEEIDPLDGNFRFLDNEDVSYFAQEETFDKEIKQWRTLQKKH